jgi:hypothetical protein
MHGVLNVRLPGGASVPVDIRWTQRGPRATAGVGAARLILPAP